MKGNISMKALFASIFTICVMLGACTHLGPPDGSSTLTNQQQYDDCSFAKTDWWTATYANLPKDVKNNEVTGDPEFCEFYQFAQDWFLYLIKSPNGVGEPNFENQSMFPLLETTGTNSCDNEFPEHALNIRTDKSKDDSEGFVLPERINQASADAIYDQQGNVVFYEIRFSRNLCDYKKIQEKPNFPGKTLEMKMAWKVLESPDNSFYQTSAIISGKTYLLGLVGWHLAITADNHPEMVWVTLDHVNNAVICSERGPDKQAYSFTSQACAQNKNCNNLNQTEVAKELTLPEGEKPNDICQVFPHGSIEGESINTRDGLNIALIKKLNNELQNKIFNKNNLPGPYNKLSYWKNYQFTGALWVSDIKEDSGSSTGNDTNQRGSLELANTVMETQFQGALNEDGTGKAGTTTNCFVCHGYNGTDSGKSNTAKSQGFGLSHIFDDIIDGQE